MYHPGMSMMFPVGSLVWAEHREDPDPGGPWIVRDVDVDGGFYTLKWDMEGAASMCTAAPDEVWRAIATFAGVVKIPSQT